jgi:arylsulfatase A-like enzyme
LKRRDFIKSVGGGIASLPLILVVGRGRISASPEKISQPNILWIIAEDTSPHFSCYGEETIETPHIDRLAYEGVRFENAFVTCPVCSPSRSALVTGMYQNSIGAHNHRSQRDYGKGRGEEIYWESYHLPKPVKLIPQYLQEAGYFTVNGGEKKSNIPGEIKLGKTDYNFIWDQDAYDSDDWRDRAAGQPFFAQYQLRGGKNREAKVPNPADPTEVTLPPYYPDNPVIRQDWADYLNSIMKIDLEVGEVLQRLDEEGLSENTVVFFLTDHGISHIRGKQFLYDEGIRIPLIVRWPEALNRNSVRTELVEHIDISATTLEIAGIPIPEYMHGRSLFDKKIKSREFIVATRDRCDETVDTIRCVRTKKYKYIRNFFPEYSHAQPNQYKDGKMIMKTMRELFKNGKLTALQASMFQPDRPVEELYDLDADPYEINNLVGNPANQKDLIEMRRTLLDWMQNVGDLGLIPESELERLGKKYGSKYAILQQKENAGLIEQIRRIMLLGERGRASVPDLLDGLHDPVPSVCYWAARKLGNLGIYAESALPELQKLMEDENGSVRTAAARAVALLGEPEQALPVLVDNLSHKNHAVRHYSALALEDMGEDARSALERMKEAQQDSYEFTRRVANRFVQSME